MDIGSSSLSSPTIPSNGFQPFFYRAKGSFELWQNQGIEAHAAPDQMPEITVKECFDIFIDQSLKNAQNPDRKFGFASYNNDKNHANVLKRLHINGLLFKDMPLTSVSKEFLEELLPWDSESDKGRLEVHRGGRLEAIAKNAMAGIEIALGKENKIEGQEKLTKRYGVLALEFLVFSDFYGGCIIRLAERKVETSAPAV